MAKYYVKQIDILFPTSASDCTSTCGRFLFKKDVAGVADCLLDSYSSGFLGNMSNHVLVRVTNNTGSRANLTSKTACFKIDPQTVDGNPTYKLAASLVTYLKDVRWPEVGWSNPITNLATFKQELAAYFNDSKVYSTNPAIWGSDDGVNILLFVINFSAGETANTFFQAAYYHGNGTGFETEITI